MIDSAYYTRSALKPVRWASIIVSQDALDLFALAREMKSKFVVAVVSESAMMPLVLSLTAFSCPIPAPKLINEMSMTDSRGSLLFELFDRILETPI